MDTFRIGGSPFEKNDFIRLHLIKWKIQSKKNRKQLINFSITSGIFLVLWFITRTNEEASNPFLLLCIFFSVFTLFFVYVRILSKQRYTRRIEEEAEKFESMKIICTYEFSDESIKYWDNEKKLEFNWSVFTNYSIYKNYLILTLNNSIIDTYIFENKGTETDIAEYNKILEIAKVKLEYKEI